MARILIVDDVEVNLNMLRCELEAQGYEVLTATTGRQALGIASAEHPDVILLDVMMPGMDGIEVCRRLREDAHTRTIPVILVTAKGLDESVIAGLDAGAVDYVPKPFNSQVLAARIRTALRIKHSYDAVARTNEMLREEIAYRKRTEDQLARFGRILECALNEIYIFDAQTYRFLQVNRGARENLGYSMEELRNLTPLDLKPEFTPESFAKLLEPLRRGEQETVDFETVHHRKDGSTYPVEMHVQPASYGESDVFVAIALDITERKRAAEALRRKDEELRQAQKLEAVGRLAGGIAHEFNNLLQVIAGYTRFAITSLAEVPEVRRDLEQVLKAADRAANLTRQLLDFSRHRTADCKPVNPNKVVESLERMVRPLLGETITLDLAIEKDVAMINADTSQLEQMLLNLCLNARDAMPEGGRLRIQTENVVVGEEDDETCGELPAGSYVLLSVSDTGCGMSPEVKERAFEPFFTTKEVGKGTGLGLATVYGIVQQHGGLILVDSEPGKGATFRIFLPAAEPPKRRRRQRPTTGERTGSEAILVAEDESLVRNVAVRILEAAGYTAIEAGDGEEALHRFHEHQDRISAVLLDAVMPKLSGQAVYRHIKKEAPWIPIVLCSGYDPETARKEFLLGDELRLIQKPFDPPVLLTTIREALDVSARPATALTLS